MRSLRAGTAALIVWGAIGCATSHGDGSLGGGSDEPGRVHAKLEEARTLRTSGHGEAALSALSEALRLATRESLPLTEELKALRDAEIAGAAETVEAAVQADLAANAPLAARRRADKLAPLLEHPLLQPIAERAKAEIAAAGLARCQAIAAQQEGRTPYLGRMLAGYCAEVGGSFSATAGPEQGRGLRVSGHLAHCTDAQQKIVEGWLADVFRDSPWFAADAPDLLPLALSGGYDARLERRRVELSAPYRAVTRSVVTEGMFGLGPTATVESESERVFQYEAEQYDARYDLDASVTLDLGTGPPLVVAVKRVDKRRAFEHEVSFPQANVYPQRANLPDVNAWLTGFLGGKKAPMLQKLRTRWVKAYCTQASFSPEEAARCLAAGEKKPAAEKALSGVFGKDAALVVEELTSARAANERTNQPKGAGTVKKAPDVEEVPRAGGGETI